MLVYLLENGFVNLEETVTQDLLFVFFFFSYSFIFAADVPSTPGKPLIMSFTSRTVNLSWAPPLDSHNAPIMEYVIRQRKGEDSSWETTRDMRTGGNTTLHTVAGLQPFTVYSFKVYSTA